MRSPEVLPALAGIAAAVLGRSGPEEAAAEGVSMLWEAEAEGEWADRLAAENLPSQAEVLAGPSPLEILEAVRDRPQELSDAVNRLWDRFTRGLRDFQKDPGALRGVQGCRQVLAGLQDFESYLEGGGQASLRRGRRRLEEGLKLLQEVAREAAREALASAPTPCPPVNWLIHAARSGEVEGALAWFEPLLAEASLRFESGATAALEGKAGTAVPRARQGFDRLRQGLARLRRGEDPLPLLEQGARLLERARAEFLQACPAAVTVSCMRCGRPQGAGERVCATCGAALPRPLPAEPGSHPRHFQRLLSVCQRAQAGETTAEELASTLEWGWGLLQSAIEGLSRLPPPENLDPRSRHLAALLEAELLALSEALEEVGCYLAGGGLSHLSAGERRLKAVAAGLEQVESLCNSHEGLTAL